MSIKKISKCNTLEPGYYKGKVVNYEILSRRVLNDGEIYIQINISIKINSFIFMNEFVSVILVDENRFFSNKDVVVELDYDYEEEKGLKVERVYDIEEGEKLIKNQDLYRTFERIGVDDYTMSLFIN